ncbi:TetR/AcrR family transcriptional regulator [Acetivibrio cellulolyticus]|uniref:TetR/AcrR family transcriptional regulator n=1 Tax=Acetivibrio cellulolyticus TaxID=35830 RepID=UPI0001E2FBC7|nr:TetR/AcrR family transcriptional regulator [Acetivibrio cellulolyticus]
MGRNLEKNIQIKEEKTELILNAAVKTFAEKGYGSTKISDIAKEAGISHGLVYQYFTSKEEIFKILIQRSLEITKNTAEQNFSIKGTPIEKIEAHVGMYINFLRDQRDKNEKPYYFMVMHQAINFEVVSDEVKKIVNDNPNPLYNLIRPLIVEGQEIGEIVEGDPDMLTEFLMQIMLGIGISNNTGQYRAPLPDKNLIMRMLRK